MLELGINLTKPNIILTIGLFTMKHLNLEVNLQSELTTNHVGDVTPVPELLDQVNKTIASVTADGAYDIEQVYKKLEAINATAIIPPKGCINRPLYKKHTWTCCKY